MLGDLLKVMEEIERQLISDRGVHRQRGVKARAHQAQDTQEEARVCVNTTGALLFCKSGAEVDAGLGQTPVQKARFREMQLQSP